MTTVTVHTSTPYSVSIGNGLLQKIGNAAATLLSGRSVVVVSDTNVAPLYLTSVQEGLETAGFSVHSFVFPAGEDSKNGETYLNLLEFLASHQLTRSDAVFALGGGVVGDLTGFAAATFLRGIPFFQCPTTLLAMVDAAVGGKTAIDLKGGKNLAGAFYQPTAVFCDLNTLQTLPSTVLSDGYAEVVKYGMLSDPDLLVLLQSGDPHSVSEAIVARCVAQKRDLVEQDERDTGSRQLLNLGHTIGHAVEACSGYQISHGKAVAIGLAAITRAAIQKELCPSSVLPSLLALLERFGLPTHTDFPPEALCEKALSDKKRTGETLTLVVPTAWGQSVLHPIPISDLLSWLRLGVAE